MIPTRLLKSSAFRLALVYMALFGVSVLVLLGFIYWTTASFMERQTQATINAEIQGLREQYALLGLPGLIHSINERMDMIESKSSLYLLTDWKFNRLAGNLQTWPRVDGEDDGWVVFSTHARGVQNAMARHFLLRGKFHLLVGRDMTERIAIQHRFIKSMIWGLAITVVMGLAGGLVMSRSMLRRIDIINRAVREIMLGDLSRRIPARRHSWSDPEPYDEFDQLVDNLNAMLDQIEQLMQGIRQVSDNIAHDLRSPLNRLRSRLEMTLISEDSTEAMREAIEKTIAEADGLLSTFNALLKIAQAEAGARREDFETLDLSRIAADMAEFYEPLAEDKDQTITSEVLEGVVIQGNQHLITQAVANLLDNAVKYSPPGGAVTLQVQKSERGPELTVADNGPGVPESERGKVLERFARLEASRNQPGSGLGLSLVSAVAKLHNAQLVLEDNQPGLRISMVFAENGKNPKYAVEQESGEGDGPEQNGMDNPGADEGGSETPKTTQA